MIYLTSDTTLKLRGHRTELNTESAAFLSLCGFADQRSKSSTVSETRINLYGNVIGIIGLEIGLSRGLLC